MVSWLSLLVVLGEVRFGFLHDPAGGVEGFELAELVAHFRALVPGLFHQADQRVLDGVLAYLDELFVGFADSLAHFLGLLPVSVHRGPVGQLAGVDVAVQPGGEPGDAAWPEFDDQAEDGDDHGIGDQAAGQ